MKEIYEFCLYDEPLIIFNRDIFKIPLIDFDSIQLYSIMQMHWIGRKKIFNSFEEIQQYLDLSVYKIKKAMKFLEENNLAKDFKFI
jgi:hypothetical protein